jgi:hypothetical protein
MTAQPPKDQHPFAAAEPDPAAAPGKMAWEGDAIPMMTPVDKVRLGWGEAGEKKKKKN